MIFIKHNLHTAQAAWQNSPLFELVCVLVCFDHVARLIVNANHSVMRAAEKLRVADCVADCIRLSVPQATEW